VKQDIRLNNRIIDLRVPANQAIFKIQSGVCTLYREFMLDNGFIEIHSPKMIGGASEGGANVFTFKYFGQDACLAQSPQLYKQMALCGDMERVFEIGPVFRAEHSNTNRHLCEFTGLDMEMVIKEHYFEVLDLLGNLFVYICQGLESRFKAELNVIKQQYPFEDFKCKSPIVKINFKDGVKMLQEAGIQQGALEDLSTETEKALGRIVREKYDTDFYMLYGYPAAARPFYTMIDPVDPDYTNSYDFFMRGEEITSGAQRIHDPEFLTERAKHFGIPVHTLQDYIDSFKYGAPAHGGAGFGLERIVKFYCNLHNIRKSSLFPRDPKRIKP
jgi:aspartyl-tRNA synthetase